MSHNGARHVVSVTGIDDSGAVLGIECRQSHLCADTDGVCLVLPWWEEIGSELIGREGWTYDRPPPWTFIAKWSDDGPTLVRHNEPEAS